MKHVVALSGGKGPQAGPGDAVGYVRPAAGRSLPGLHAVTGMDIAIWIALLVVAWNVGRGIR